MKKFLPIALGVMLFAPFFHAEDLPFEIPPVETEKEALELSGNLGAVFSGFPGKNESPLYRLMYSNHNLSGYLASYAGDFYLNGDYQTQYIGIHLKTRTTLTSGPQFDFSFLEAYGSLHQAVNFMLSLGKKRYNWGKGYAFNPVGYVNPPKDPRNPELFTAGMTSLDFEYSQSFTAGPLNNLAVELIFIPAEGTGDNPIAELRDGGLAGRLYLLLWDTDIDLLGYYSKVKPRKIGLDFSRNVFSNLEIHGELSYYDAEPKYILLAGVPATGYIRGISWLAGVRWLNGWNMTAILEYYHNDAGLTKEEFVDYTNFLSGAADSGASQEISHALTINKNYFGSPALMQNYLYFKLNWPEPFGLVDITPSAHMLYNLDDSSSSIGVTLNIKPITNFELTLQAVFLVGKDHTEFGIKPYNHRLDAEARFYF